MNSTENSKRQETIRKTNRYRDREMVKDQKDGLEVGNPPEQKIFQVQQVNSKLKKKNKKKN